MAHSRLPFTRAQQICKHAFPQCHTNPSLLTSPVPLHLTITSHPHNPHSPFQISQQATLQWHTAPQLSLGRQHLTITVHPHPTSAHHPAPDSTQATTATTAQPIPTPGPTQAPLPTTYTQHQSPTRLHRSRTPLSRHRRTNRSKQRRSSAQGRNKRSHRRRWVSRRRRPQRSTRQHSATRRRRPRRNYSRSRSTRSRSASYSAHTRSRRDSRRRTPSPRSSPSPTPRTSRSPEPRVRLQPAANLVSQQFQRVARTMRSANAGPHRNPPPPPPPTASKTPPTQLSRRHSDNASHGNSSQQPFNIFTNPLPPCIDIRPAAEVPHNQRPTLNIYDIEDVERWIEKVREICGDSAVDGFTSDQLVDLSRMLHAAGYIPNDRGIEAIRWVEIDSLYPTLVISLHDPDLFEGNAIPFRAPPPFGVTDSEWRTNPPAVSYYTFVHGTSFQAGAEILREGVLRPTALPRSARATSSVVYGAATPGDISDYTMQTATAQLLKRPKGRNDIILLCTLATTEQHYKASWSSLTDEAHVCRRRGILRNSDRWGAHAVHLHVQGLLMVGHNR